MDELLASGRFVDGIIVLVAIEFAVLAIYRARTGRGIAPFDLAANLAAGASLLLALRAALAGAGLLAILVCLTGALLAHVIDLRRRWSAANRE